MAQYHGSIKRLNRNPLDGDIRLAARVTVTRFDTPNGKPVKAGAETVRAWTVYGLMHVARQRVDELMRRDMARQRSALNDAIARIIETI